MSVLVNKIHANLTGQTVTSVAFTMPSDEQIEEIVSIIKQIVAALKACKKTPETAVPSVTNPTTTEVNVVKKAVRKELGFVKNLFQGGKYTKAVLNSGKTASVTDVKEVW